MSTGDTGPVRQGGSEGQSISLLRGYRGITTGSRTMEQTELQADLRVDLIGEYCYKV